MSSNQEWMDYLSKYMEPINEEHLRIREQIITQGLASIKTSHPIWYLRSKNSLNPPPMYVDKNE